MLKQKNIHVILSIAACICSAALSLVIWYPLQEESEAEREKKIVHLIDDNMQNSSSHAEWKGMHDINSDFIGWLNFENDLISQPVVQTDNNEKYLHTDFLGKENSRGTVFMDQQDKLNMQGILFYGHNVFYDSFSMFSPLTTLLDQKIYERNRMFSLLLENEIRTYEITHVLQYDITTRSFDQRRSSFEEPDAFNKWVQYADENNCIRPFQTLSNDDRFCILQTCVKDNADVRLLVIAKESERKSV